MENDVDKKLAEQYFPRFGKIAINMGFITAEQLTEAITEQAEDSLYNRPHRPIGYILSEKGWITNEQVDIVIDIFLKAPVLEYQPFLNSLLKLA